MPEGAPAVRVGDADRDRVATLLRERCVTGHLSLEEFAERTDSALAARTRDELDAVTRDLPADREAAVAPRLGARTHAVVIGGLERRGRWRLPQRLRVMGLIGGAELDLSDAVIEAEETTIEAWWVIGGLEIVAPEGIEVEVEGVTVIGGVEHDSPGRVLAGAPRIRVRHFALIGGTEITTRRARSV